MPNPQETLTELQWRAFRFVANELEPLELAQFEAQLAEDQAAREAVAQMLELSLTLASSVDHDLPAKPLLPQPTAASETWWHPVLWMSIGVLACSVFVAVWSGWPGPDGASDRSGLAPETTALAAAWTEARRAPLPPADEWESWMPAAEVPETSGEARPLSTEDATDADLGLQPPAWMLAAVQDLDEYDHTPDGAE